MTLLSNQYLFRPLPLHVLSIGRFNAFGNFVIFQTLSAFTSTAWPTANQAIYVPMVMPERFTVARFLVANGAAVDGTVDVGLYSASLAKLISTGPTTQTGTSVVQYIDVTDQSFPPGNYFLALLLSSTSGRTFASSTGSLPLARMSGMTRENVGADTLPSTMTPASSLRVSCPCFGFSQSGTL